MILAFEGFEKSIELPLGQATTVEINNRKLFARIVQSIVGGAKEPLEPFTLWKDDSEVKSSAAFYYLADPIHLPYRDSKFEGLMLESIQNELHRNVDAYIELESLIERAKRIIEDGTLALNSDYSLAISLDMPKLLKSLGFCVDGGEERPLLDNLIQFMGFTKDIGFDKWIVVTNLKSFFDKKDLEIFFDQADFYDFSCLLLETSHDSERHRHEIKYQVDEQFIENW